MDTLEMNPKSNDANNKKMNQQKARRKWSSYRQLLENTETSKLPEAT
jgi:hypothetical protein